MTDKELQKLKRSELLEIMLGLQNELDWQKKENQELKKKVGELTSKAESRTISIEKAGSIAQAALEMNGVFTAAQQAADVYLENIRKMHEDVEKNYEMTLNKAKAEAQQIVDTAKKNAEELKIKSETEYRAKIKEADEESSRRINETNALCTKKIMETQEKCTAISSLDNQIASFFHDKTAAAAAGGTIHTNHTEQMPAAEQTRADVIL